MQERLTLLRPPDAGRTLAVAIHDVDRAQIQLDPASIGRITARLACGSFGDVQHLLHRPPPGPALPLVLARYLRWSGDVQTAVAAWPAVERSLRDIGAAPYLRRATFDELQPAAIDVGSPALAGRLRALAREANGTNAPDEPDAAVRTILDITLGLLGLAPDAVRGRIGLRLRADSQAAIEARHIRCGDASIAITAARGDRDVLIRVEQTAGAIPFTALLEPVVANAVGAEVDAAPADLMIRRTDIGVIVPVQLVLDDVRTLRIRTRD